MSRKTLAASGVAALAVATVVGGGTFAAFVDTESSNGNSISAGTLDLVLSEGTATTTGLALNNVKPGDTGTQTITLTNPGSIGAGGATVSFVDVANAENKCLEPEAEALDTTCAPATGTQAEKDLGAGLGELQNLLKVTVKNGTTVLYDGLLKDVPATALTTKTAPLGASSVPQPQAVTVDWAFVSQSDALDSQAMTDSVSFKLKFDIEQGVSPTSAPAAP